MTERAGELSRESCVLSTQELLDLLDVDEERFESWEKSLDFVRPHYDRSGARCYTMRDVRIYQGFAHRLRGSPSSAEELARTLQLELQTQSEQLQSMFQKSRAGLIRAWQRNRALSTVAGGAKATEPSGVFPPSLLRHAVLDEGTLFRPHDEFPEVDAPRTMLVLSAQPHEPFTWDSQILDMHPGLAPLGAGMVVLDRAALRVRSLLKSGGAWWISSCPRYVNALRQHVARRRNYGLAPDALRILEIPDFPSDPPRSAGLWGLLSQLSRNPGGFSCMLVMPMDRASAGASCLRSYEGAQAVVCRDARAWSGEIFLRRSMSSLRVPPLYTRKALGTDSADVDSKDVFFADYEAWVSSFPRTHSLMVGQQRRKEGPVPLEEFQAMCRRRGLWEDT